MTKMTWRSLLERWGLGSIRINGQLLDTELAIRQPDRDAAWDLYVELVTRITTQPLPRNDGTDQSALDSVYALFGLTRQAIKAHGRHCREFSRLAIVILNQKVRPFTSKWHRIAETEGFSKEEHREQFRTELEELQELLRGYAKLLATLAEVEDLTDLCPQDQC